MIELCSVYLSAQRIDLYFPVPIHQNRFHLWYFYLSDELKKNCGINLHDKGTQ